MAKRASGEGTVYKRKGKNIPAGALWCAQTPRLGVGDKKKRFSFYGPTQAAAIEARRKGLEELENSYQGATGVTLAGFFETWIAHKRHGDAIKFGSERTYRRDFERHVVPVLGRAPISEVGALELQTLVNALAERGLVRSANKVRVVLSGMFKQALEWDLVRSDPTAKMKPIKAPPKILEDDEAEAELWTPAQTRAFLRAAETGGKSPLYAYYPLFHFALNTGMRSGEILGLQWKHVGADIKVRQTLHYVNAKDRAKADAAKGLKHVTGPFYLGPPKTAKGRRDLPLPDGLRGRLEVMRERQEALKRLLGDHYEDHGFVFPAASGKPLYWRNMLRTFDALKSLTERSLRVAHDDPGYRLPHVRFHDLRILYASNLVRVRKLPPTDIRDLLGHETTDVAEKVYIRVMAEQKQAHAIELDELLTSETRGITEGITDEGVADLLGITKEEKAA